MALNFPNTPNDGDVFRDPTGTQWVYELNSDSWTSVGAAIPAGAQVWYRGSSFLTPIYAGDKVNPVALNFASNADTLTGTSTTTIVTPAGAKATYLPLNISSLTDLP
jgi:hypothetical protein